MNENAENNKNRPWTKKEKRDLGLLAAGVVGTGIAVTTLPHLMVNSGSADAPTMPTPSVGIAVHDAAATNKVTAQLMQNIAQLSQEQVQVQELRQELEASNEAMEAFIIEEVNKTHQGFVSEVATKDPKLAFEFMKQQEAFDEAETYKAKLAIIEGQLEQLPEEGREQFANKLQLFIDIENDTLSTPEETQESIFEPVEGTGYYRFDGDFDDISAEPETGFDAEAPSSPGNF